MNDVPKRSSATVFLCAASLLVIAPSDSSFAQPGTEESALLSIGLPPAAGESGGSPAANPETGQHVLYEFGRFSLRGGPPAPAVGLAPGRMPDGGAPPFASDNFHGDRLAISASARFDPERLGSHRLTGRTSFLDLTPFQTNAYAGDSEWVNSATTDKRRSNEGSAFDLTLEGRNLPLAPSLSYRLTYIQQTNAGDADGERMGLSAGIASKFDFGQGMIFTPSLEAARMTDTDVPDRDFLTASMLTEWRSWNLSLTYSRQDADGPTAALADDYQAQAYIGYVFDFGMTADVGWERMKRAEDVADRIGFQFRYQLGFGR